MLSRLLRPGGHFDVLRRPKLTHGTPCRRVEQKLLPRAKQNSNRTAVEALALVRSGRAPSPRSGACRDRVRGIRDGEHMIALSPPPGPLKVLCIGAHPDDVEIGCGGTLLELAARGDACVSTVVLTGSPERRREAESAGPRFFPDDDRHRARPAREQTAGGLGRDQSSIARSRPAASARSAVRPADRRRPPGPSAHRTTGQHRVARTR